MDVSRTKQVSNREVKASVFTTYFSDPKNAAQLYSALEGVQAVPEFYVFYNGDEPFPPEKIFKLSDAYLEKINTPILELLVKVINMNIPTGHTIWGYFRTLCRSTDRRR